MKSRVESLASRPVDVHESDFLVLSLCKINMAEAMAFRFPMASDFDDTLELRANAWHMMEVAKHAEVVAYDGRRVEALRATVPEGMRAPTPNEARRCDREIMAEILKVVAKGSSSVGAGLHHYAEAYPDQGLEKGSQQTCLLYTSPSPRDA